MRYSELSDSELNDAINQTRTALEHGKLYLEALARDFISNAVRKPEDATAKQIRKLEP